MIPWSLYNLTPRDQGSPNLRPFFSHSSVILGAGDIQSNVTHTVPDDYVLLVTFIGVTQISPTNFPSYNRFILQEPGHVHADQYDHWQPGVPVGSVIEPAWSSKWSGSPLFLVHPRDSITTSARKAGLGTAWEAFHSVAGVLIPKGTISAN